MVPIAEDDEPEPSATPPGRGAKRRRAVSVDSDDLDADDGDEADDDVTAGPSSRASLSAKGTPSGSATPSLGLGASPGPLKAVGEFMNCGECGRKFPVVSLVAWHRCAWCAAAYLVWREVTTAVSPEEAVRDKCPATNQLRLESHAAALSKPGHSASLRATAHTRPSTPRSTPAGPRRGSARPAASLSASTRTPGPRSPAPRRRSRRRTRGTRLCTMRWLRERHYSRTLASEWVIGLGSSHVRVIAANIRSSASTLKKSTRLERLAQLEWTLSARSSPRIVASRPTLLRCSTPLDGQN